jgi:serine O-acetyltransferase
MRITTWAEYRDWTRQDLAAIDPARTRWRYLYRYKYPTVHFLRKLRLAELFLNRARGPVGRALALLLRHRAREAGMRLGFSIPPGVFGPGLAIVHWGTIVVNDKARVGARCRLHPCTVIATKDGAEPVIGDDAYIGPGAKIMGGIHLGDRVAVGANAVVNRSFPDDSVVAGVPARLIGQATEG